ncbi:type II secretion system secretin GspD [Trichlorobacter lovleyi]|uniref:type II secretion system secretin GspD n=1 Tax=Trichlorobacter lovleyi TaxID=313985 RepID=UPI00223F5B5A|nr:type II secretion system secretin GspD [Trichlorobacter lovleyi]QOX78405.1 type II secretion system secretin GspD [Trichlorobacter lovleyi]
MKQLKALLIVLLLLTLCSSPLHAAGQGVIMNFTDVEIATMVKFISELTGKNFVLDERVKGKVSVFSPSKLSQDEAFALFTSVLELKGFTLIQAGKIYKVVPTGSAKQAGMKLADKERIPLGDAFLARVFPLSQISSQEALTFLQPIISKEGHIGSFGPGNMLLVVDAASNLQKVADILSLIDTPQRREGAELVYLKHGSAEGVTKVLQEWLAGRGARQVAVGTAQSANSGAVQVLADTRLNAVLLFGPEKDKKDIRSLIAQLDVTPPEASSKINVCFLENTDATEMAKVLDGVVKGITAQTTTLQAGTVNTQSSPFDSGKVTITADKASNSLVVMASPTDYNNLLQVIKKLDRRSKQVFVQVLIAEVSPEKSRSLGVQAGAFAAGALGKYLQGGGLYDPFNTIGQVFGTSSSGSTNPISSLISDKLKSANRPVTGIALIQALESEGVLNILSTPNILTTDNKEAEINVGENVPFKSSTTQSTFGSTESIERKDIGINLKIKPQVSEGDYIRMDIYQEISAVKSSKGDAVDLVTTKRSAKTSVVVKDKETIVIGGLIQDSEENSVQKVPLLGDIPGLGWFFKTNTKTRKKTNLLIMLTPQVVKDARDLTTITDDQKGKFSDTTKKFGPLDVQSEISGKAIKPVSQEQENRP